MNVNEQVARAAGGCRNEKSSLRFFVVGVAFLVYEAVLVVVFGDYFYADISSAMGASGMVALAAAGYFALGYFSRSWFSAALLLVFLLVAAAIGRPGPTVATADGLAVAVHPNPELASLWLTFSLVFVPAWAAGALVAKRRS